MPKTEPKTDKPWWVSKTIIANAVALIASLAGGYGLDIGFEAQGQITTGVLAVVNIGLRFVTDKPVRKPRRDV